MLRYDQTTGERIFDDGDMSLEPSALAPAMPETQQNVPATVEDPVDYWGAQSENLASELRERRKEYDEAALKLGTATPQNVLELHTKVGQAAMAFIYAHQQYCQHLLHP